MKKFLILTCCFLAFSGDVYASVGSTHPEFHSVLSRDAQGPFREWLQNIFKFMERFKTSGDVEIV